MAFAITAWVFLGLEVGLRDLLRLGHTGIAPSFVMVFVAFIAMSAPARSALWAGLVLGVLSDITTRVALTTPGGSGIVLGPHAVAYLAAVQLVVAVRGVMMRRNPLTLGFLALVAALIAAVVLVAVMSLRRLFDPLLWDATGELGARAGSAVYTGVVGTLLAFALFPMAGFLGMPSVQGRRFSRQ